jgi:hypothetical protein
VIKRLNAVIAELVAGGTPHYQPPDTLEAALEAAPQPPVYWHTHEDEGGNTTALHISGQDWQVEIVEAPAESETWEVLETRAINLEAVAIGTLAFWPGLAAAECFGLLAREIWEQWCEEEDEEGATESTRNLP